MRILLADDHRLMLDAVRRALEADGGFEVVGQTQDGTAVAALVEQLQPDLVVLDVRMPRMDGLACLDEIHRRFPATKVVMLSASNSSGLVENALRRGASGYIAKSVDPNELPATLRRIVDGEVVAMVAEGFGAAGSDVSLTNREASILQAVARGLSNEDIAKELWVTQQTVKFHLTNIYRKLGAKNRTEATRLAVQRGLVESPFYDEE